MPLNKNILPGARIAVDFEGSFYAGVAQKIDGDGVYVYYDSQVKGQTSFKPALGQHVHMDYVQPIDYLGISARPITPVPWKKSVEQYYLDKRGTQTNMMQVYGCWLWVNYAVFNNKLTPPLFSSKAVDGKRNSYGTYSSNPSLTVSTLYVNFPKHRSNYRVLETVAHEMIHQYQRWESIDSGIPKEKNVHGSSFIHWIPIIKEKTGVTVTVTGTDGDDETIYEQKKTVPVYYVVIRFVKDRNVFTGAWTKNIVAARNTSAAWGRVDGVMNRPKIYETTDPNYQTIMKQLNTNSFKMTVAPMGMVKKLVNNSQPI